MKKIASSAFMAMVYAFLYIPMVILIVNSFNADRYGIRWRGFDLKWYEKLLSNDSLIQATINSLAVAIVAATLATIIGTLIAIALYRYAFKGKKFIGSMLFIVMMSPDIVMAVSFLALFLMLGISLGFYSLLTSHITFCLPFVVIAVLSRLNGFDVRMLDAAKDLGASELVILRKVILPLILPAVVSGWIMSFTISLDDVVISSFVTGVTYEVLPLKIFSLVKTGVTPEINALATLMILGSLILIGISQLLLRKSKI